MLEEDKSDAGENEGGLIPLLPESNDGDQGRNVVGEEVIGFDQTDDFNWDMLVEMRAMEDCSVLVDGNGGVGLEVDDVHEELSLPVSIWDL